MKGYKRIRVRILQKKEIYFVDSWVLSEFGCFFAQKRQEFYNSTLSLQIFSSFKIYSVGQRLFPL